MITAPFLNDIVKNIINQPKSIANCNYYDYNLIRKLVMIAITI
ncbi:hypothetical protein JM48_2622 [Lactiplantibacillus plantarum]|nr:hypothetical protein JM48_2622 [Lactiplantibacillus plantarum]